MMKKYIYIILSSFFLFSCGENDYSYDGEQAISLGGGTQKNITFVVDEEIQTYQLSYGLLNAATQDFTFEVEIAENTGGDVVTANGKSSGAISLTIPQGQRVGHIDINASFEKLTNNVDETLKLRIKNKESVGCTVLDSVFTITIQKFCTLTSERIKEWEGVYKEVEDNWYEMTIKHYNGDTLVIDNFWGYNAYPANLSPIKIVLDYSTKNYTVKVVNGHFYDDPSWGPLEIRDELGGEPLTPKRVDFCSKIMQLYYTRKVAAGYFSPLTSTLYKVRELP